MNILLFARITSLSNFFLYQCLLTPFFDSDFCYIEVVKINYHYPWKAKSGIKLFVTEIDNFRKQFHEDQAIFGIENTLSSVFSERYWIMTIYLLNVTFKQVFFSVSVYSVHNYMIYIFVLYIYRKLFDSCL